MSGEYHSKCHIKVHDVTVLYMHVYAQMSRRGSAALACTRHVVMYSVHVYIIRNFRPGYPILAHVESRLVSTAMGSSKVVGALLLVVLPLVQELQGTPICV